MIEISSIEEKLRIVDLLLLQENRSMKNKHNNQIKSIERIINPIINHRIENTMIIDIKIIEIPFKKIIHKKKITTIIIRIMIINWGKEEEMKMIMIIQKEMENIFVIIIIII